MSFRRLPPLQSLIAFESAARLLSFKEASEELFLTPPAVTYRIKELESVMGVQLFIRTPKGLELTPTAREYYVKVETALKSLRDATHEAQAQNFGKQLKVQMLPFLASEVVIPKLSDFYQQYPDIDIQIDTKYALADFQREDVDVAIRFGLGDWNDLDSRLVMPANVTLVCSSSYTSRNRIEKLADLNRSTLISLANEKYNWEEFASQAGIEKIKPQRVLHFNDYTLCLRAAEQGMGITFGVLPLVQQWLDSKRLIHPFPLEYQLPQAYYFCQQADSNKQAQIDAFYHWLVGILPAHC